MIIHTFPLPELVPEDARFDVSLCIDVLRATTVFVTAKRQGVREIIPCLTVDEARQRSAEFATTYPDTPWCLGGERKGLRIDGFDLANSPREYTREAVGGRVLFFTTTNGTRALRRATGLTVPVCFLNAREEVQAILTRAQDSPELAVGIICAGTDGFYTDEDLLLAGCLVELLHRGLAARGGPAPTLNGESTSVWGRWQDFVAAVPGSAYPWETGRGDSGGDGAIGNVVFRRALLRRLRKSRGGSNLVALGLGQDIEFAVGLQEPDKENPA
ncbi:MAG: 2-phosphosulfolactate phosphatase [Planctomycetia bacterium]|nr:2-phosphosulfolactate phosphatase [Planctomycetia bacterium]